MPRNLQSGRSANGAGSIRKVTKQRDGKTYTYWEGRYTIGFDPVSGKQLQRYVSGKSQKEVAQKLRQATAEIDRGDYIEPCKMTFACWLDFWLATYLGGVKERTAIIYKSDIEHHIKPFLGAVALSSLDSLMIQNFYNDLSHGKDGKPGLSAKTVKNIHGVVHESLKRAVINGVIQNNPSDSCILPRIVKKEIRPLDEDDISAFLKAIQGHRFADIFMVALFTGMREGEVLGLTWDVVNFSFGTITISKQIQLHQEGNSDAYELVSPKNDRKRVIVAPPSVMLLLKNRRKLQDQQKLLAGSAWCNPQNLIFTNDLGGHLTKPTVYRSFKKVVAAIGRPDARFHDLRHSYAMVSLRSGDDIKTLQNNLGHATAAFTLDVYGHVSDRMKSESAARMEQFIKAISGQ